MSRKNDTVICAQNSTRVIAPLMWHVNGTVKFALRRVIWRLQQRVGWNTKTNNCPKQNFGNWLIHKRTRNIFAERWNTAKILPAMRQACFIRKRRPLRRTLRRKTWQSQSHHWKIQIYLHGIKSLRKPKLSVRFNQSRFENYALKSKKAPELYRVPSLDFMFYENSSYRFYNKCLGVGKKWFYVKCLGVRKFSHCKTICIFAFCPSSEVPRTTGNLYWHTPTANGKQKKCSFARTNKHLM